MNDGIECIVKRDERKKQREEEKIGEGFVLPRLRQQIAVDVVRNAQFIHDV